MADEVFTEKEMEKIPEKNVIEHVSDYLFDYLMISDAKKASKIKGLGVEHTGFEPVTSTLPVWRAPSCANAPCGIYYNMM